MSNDNLATNFHVIFPDYLKHCDYVCDFLCNQNLNHPLQNLQILSLIYLEYVEIVLVSLLEFDDYLIFHVSISTSI